MTDESVDTFYSCILCQSFAPNHVCVVSPERLGLCGAYNWLDAKAAFEIDPNGANQPILKGIIDAVRGHGTLTSTFTRIEHTIARSTYLYGASDDELRVLEAIVALLPELNGVMVNREYRPDPAGMKFSTLANMTGGGSRRRVYRRRQGYVDRKFISAEGGHQRIV
jgi:acetyl-CoA synthase